MRLDFRWTSGHRSVQVRLLMADGDDVTIVDASGNRMASPATVKNGGKLKISKSSVAYGTKPDWLVVVLVDDVTSTKMKGFTITAHYEDTTEPEKTEPLCKDEDVEANKGVPFRKKLTIPRRSQA